MLVIDECFKSAELFAGGRRGFCVSLVSGRVKGEAGKGKQDPGIVKKSCFISACPVVYSSVQDVLCHCALS